VFAHSRQGLVVSEAAARVDGGAPPALGRPACAVIPQVLNHGNAALRLGCCGARAYLDALTDSTALWALPAGKLEQYCEQITAPASANRALTRFTDVAERMSNRVDDRPCDNLSNGFHPDIEI
jgi:uncharacterized protein (DUF169 family)